MDLGQAQLLSCALSCVPPFQGHIVKVLLLKSSTSEKCMRLRWLLGRDANGEIAGYASDLKSGHVGPWIYTETFSAYRGRGLEVLSPLSYSVCVHDRLFVSLPLALLHLIVVCKASVIPVLCYVLAISTRTSGNLAVPSSKGK